MRELTLRMPTFSVIVGTRAAMAFGIGLLVSQRIPERRRKAIGTALVAIGALTTVPAIRTVADHLRHV
jgi:hypothetical protein